MSIFKKLLDLNQDIEILENYQNFKAANILHKKFLKEAQGLEPTRKTETYIQVFNKYLTNASTNPSQSLINQIRADGFLFKEDQDKLINLISSKMNATTPTPATQPAASTQPVTATQPVAATPTSATNNQIQSAPQTLSDTANNNAVMESFYSATNQASQANQPQNIFSKLINDAKNYLSVNDFNSAAIIRDQAANSNMSPEQKNAWQQQYNTLVQNISGTANTPQYNIQQSAQNDIFNAATQLGLSRQQVIPQNIAKLEPQIRQKLQQMNKLNPASDQLLRQISLSAYYIPQR